MIMHKTIYYQVTLQPRLSREATRPEHTRRAALVWRALGPACCLSGGCVAPSLGGWLLNQHAALAGGDFLSHLLGVACYAVTIPLVCFAGWRLCLVADDAMPTGAPQVSARPHPTVLAMTGATREKQKAGSL